MKYLLRRLLFVFLLCFLTSSINAQLVTVPDSFFVSWLNSNGYAQCMTGNQLDSTCAAVQNTTFLNLNGLPMDDMTGIVAFVNLDSLICKSIFVDTFPDLPQELKFLDCEFSHVRKFTSLPPTLTELNCNGSDLIAPLPVNNLESFSCTGTSINNLNFLNSSTIKNINCYGCPVTNAGIAPVSGFQNLVSLNYGLTQVSLPPVFPASLKDLRCWFHLNLPVLPAGLLRFDCSDAGTQTMPALPATLKYLNCNNNNLDSLILQLDLDTLICSYGSLAMLSLSQDSISYLDVSHNGMLHCLPPVKITGEFQWTNTPISCLPYVMNIPVSVPPASTLPVCDMYNSAGCSFSWSIMGNIYRDAIVNCIADSTEMISGRFKVNLISGGSVVQQCLTNDVGEYSFNAANGNYILELDTGNSPFIVSCPAGNQYSVTISSLSPVYAGKDFAIECDTDFDNGVLTVLLDSGIFRPANEALVRILAGDLTSQYGLNCSGGQGGDIRVILNGPCQYAGPSPNALIPSVIGNTLVYSIVDFGTINYAEDLVFKLITDTTALITEQICLDVFVDTLAGDVDPVNNSYSHCFNIVNSYDPNDKQVSPAGLTDTSQLGLTYTIRFQNTGNAPAQHIYILDTLDQNIDVSSFQLLAYDHNPLVQISGNVVKFNYPNINLPDSTSNEPASHGYVQYRVKRYPGLPVGTQIRNTAYIYFDFNSPVVTNTTVNEIYDATVGITEIQDKNCFRIYPNPVTSGRELKFETDNLANAPSFINIYDSRGRKVFTHKINLTTKKGSILLPGLTPGLYMCELKGAGIRLIEKLVIID